jgi:hypothetical protein
MGDESSQPAETFTEYQTQQEELRIRAMEAENERVRLLGPPPRAADHVGLWGALLAAQADFPAIVRGKSATVKTKGDGSYSYDYADLGDILAVVGPILRAYGLILTQPIVQTPSGPAIRSTLVHVLSGEREVSEFPLPMGGSTAQQVGSLITYFRRYSAQAILGITTESDSDAQDVNVPRREASSPRGGSSAPRRASQGSGAPTRTSPSVGVLMGELKLAVEQLTTDGGRAEWEDWKAEKGWDRIWASSPEVRETKRSLIEEALRVVRSAVVGEKAAAGAEPWDPLQGAGDPGDPLPGDEVDPVTGTDWEGDGPYG